MVRALRRMIAPGFETEPAPRRSDHKDFHRGCPKPPTAAGAILNRKTTLIIGLAVCAAIAAAVGVISNGRGSHAVAADAGVYIRSGVALHPFKTDVVEQPDGALVFAPRGDDEAGVELSLAGARSSVTGARMVAVFFELDADDAFNIREDFGEGARYTSSALRGHVILGGSPSSSALIYSHGYDRASIRIVGVEPCDGAVIICEADGSIAKPVRLTKGAPALSATAYNGGEIAFDAKNGVLHVERLPDYEGEYGVTLRLAPAKTAKRVAVVFDRQPALGVSLSRRNKEGLAYLPAERRHVVLEPGDEALFFTASVDRFAVKFESVSTCASDNWRCRTRHEFEELLPQADANATKFERALQLLRWASKNIDFALTRSVNAEFRPSSSELHKVYFRFFALDQGGGFCGGTSVFFRRLLADQGIEAFTWNFGVLKDDLTHVTTIVPMNGEFYLMDATFGGYLAKKGSTQPIDIFDYLGGAPADFIPVDMTGRQFIAKINEKKVAHGLTRGLLRNCVDDKSRGTVHCEYPVFGLENYARMWGERLARNGIAPDGDALRTLMLRGTFSVAGGRLTPETRAFVMKLKERGVPFIDAPGSPSPEDMLN